MPILSPFEGTLLFVTYGVVMLLLTSYFTKRVLATPESYLLADREVKPLVGAISIGAAWVWAGAIFVSSEVAYKWGWPGLFYFSIMNVLCIAAFAPFAQRMRNLAPRGFTWSSYLKNEFSNRVQTIWLVLFTAFVIGALTLNIFAASKLIQTLTGLDFAITSVVLTCLALLYNFRKGLRATIVTEIFKYVVVAAAVLLIVPALFSATEGWATFEAGLGGITGKHTALWGTEEAWTLFITYGLITAVGHLSNPWADNSFHQRAFAVEEKKVGRTFVLASLLFVSIPLLVGSIGIFAAGSGITVEGSTQMINVIAIGQLLPEWMVVVFAFAAFAAMVSVTDSQLTSLSSLLTVDVHEKIGGSTDALSFGRYGMLLVAIATVLLVNVPGFTLLFIIMTLAVVRVTSMFPGLLSVVGRKYINEPGMFWGLAVGLVLGVPAFAYGKYFGEFAIMQAGFFTTLIVVPLSILIVSRVTR